MYVQVQHRTYRYYVCAAARRGYDSCTQVGVHQETIDEQVIEALFHLHENLSSDVSQRIEKIVRQHAQHEAAMQHMEEIRAMVERIDFSWEKGFMDEATYIQKRQQLQTEIEMQRPVEYDELLKSANLLADFRALWARCKTRKAQHELIKQIVERVIVLDQEVIALILKGDTALLFISNTLYPVGERGVFTQSGIMIFLPQQPHTLRQFLGHMMPITTGTTHVQQYL